MRAARQRQRPSSTFGQPQSSLSLSSQHEDKEKDTTKDAAISRKRRRGEKLQNYHDYCGGGGRGGCLVVILLLLSSIISVVLLLWATPLMVAQHTTTFMNDTLKNNHNHHHHPHSSSHNPQHTLHPQQQPFPPILTIYAESPDDNYDHHQQRTTKSLTKLEFPRVQDCSLQDFPIDDFPSLDPFLPWIHDYFVSVDQTRVQFVAQNKRRCHTGQGMEQRMKYWEPQMALFQPVPIRIIKQHQGYNSNNTSPPFYYYSLSSPETATIPETRFLCFFHTADHSVNATTFSVFPFNYEFVSWRKHLKGNNSSSSMFETHGKDTSKLETSQLLFSCPIPQRMQQQLHRQQQQQQKQKHQQSTAVIYVDVIPIRTPARTTQVLLTRDHVGPREFERIQVFDTEKEQPQRNLPSIQDSGRWANLRLCPRTDIDIDIGAGSSSSNNNNGPKTTTTTFKQHRLVACTWTAASYHRRGDVTKVQDSHQRLREWILFHQMVGVDHLYIYDNTQIPENATTTTPVAPSLRAIVDEFDPSFVTYISWKAKICNNNRPQHSVPGERSSQYAAEASCRERYGPLTDWLVFMDTDEYLVPHAPNHTSWHTVLDQAERDNVHVLKMKSARGRPREELLVSESDPNVCSQPSSPQVDDTTTCLVPRSNETFLRVYNCDYIKLPRPERFSRAMKQIYRPDFVLQHFVHYSCVTKPMATYYKDRPDKDSFQRRVMNHEWGDVFLDELSQGVLVHTKSVLPHETLSRNASCNTGSKNSCPIGVVCPSSTPFVFGDHQSNAFQDEQGRYCNCWVNEQLEHYWIPKLNEALKKHTSKA